MLCPTLDKWRPLILLCFIFISDRYNIIVLMFQIDEVQQLDGIESVCRRVVELLLVRRTAGHRRDGRLEKRLQHQRILHIRRQRDDRAGQRNVKVHYSLYPGPS